MDYYWELCTFVTGLLSEIPVHMWVGVCDLNEKEEKNTSLLQLG